MPNSATRSRDRFTFIDLIVCLQCALAWPQGLNRGAFSHESKRNALCESRTSVCISRTAKHVRKARRAARFALLRGQQTVQVQFELEDLLNPRGITLLRSQQKGRR